MTSRQTSFPIAPEPVPASPSTARAAPWVSELLPHTAKIVDDLCFIRSMHTEAINHDPAITFFQTGAQIAGRPSIGSWLAYGLGSENQDLPAFVVLISPRHRQQRRSAAVRPALGQRLFAVANTKA